MTHIAQTSFGRSRSLWIAGIVAGVVAISGLVAALIRSSAPVTPPAPAGESTGARAASKSSAVAGPAAAPSVRVSIVAFPKHADLSLDGRRIGNPFVTELAADASLHELEVSAEGYQTSSRVLGLQHDVQLVVELKKLALPKSARAAAPRPEKQSVSANPPPRAVAPAQAAPQPARSSDSSPLPGQDLRGSSHAPRAIDEKDLYQ